MFQQFFGLFSNNCWLRMSELGKGVCFAKAVRRGALEVVREDGATDVAPPRLESREEAAAAGMRFFVASRDAEERHQLESSGFGADPLPEFVRRTLGFSGLRLTQPLVGIVSRRQKRFLLNEEQLVHACHDLGLPVAVLALESMTLHEQMLAFATTTVLVGVHGSALTNVQFMTPGTAVLQLLPYNVHGGSQVCAGRCVCARTSVYRRLPTTPNAVCACCTSVFQAIR